MKYAVIAVGSLLSFTLLGLWLVTQLHYRIGSRHLKVLLFKFTIRRIDLTDIKHISKRRPSKLGEYWCNTFKLNHRMLTIQRRSGLRKYFVISPRNRYVFLADLKNAIKRASPEVEWTKLDEEEEETSHSPAPREHSLSRASRAG